MHHVYVMRALIPPSTLSVSDLPTDRVTDNTSIFYGFQRSPWILAMRTTTNDHALKLSARTIIAS